MSFLVLLVEDNAMNLELHRDLLEASGQVVLVAESAAEFRKRITGMIPDVVLLDILLPDGTGIELLAELRALPAFAAVAVIAVTAHALSGDVRRLLGAGFDAVITKPIDTETFAAEVARWAVRRPGSAAFLEGGP